MRSDYGLYVVALICFIIAGVFLSSAVPGYTLADSMGAAVIGIFLILGVLFIVSGYTVRPKVAVPTPTAPPPLPTEPSPPLLQPSPPVEEKVEEAPVAPPPAEEEALAAPPVPPTPPTPAPEEPAKVEAVEEKPVRRRRRKKTE